MCNIIFYGDIIKIKYYNNVNKLVLFTDFNVCFVLNVKLDSLSVDKSFSPLKSPSPITDISLSPDGGYLYVLYNNKIYILNCSNVKIVTFADKDCFEIQQSDQATFIDTIETVTDDKIIIICDNSRAIKIWALEKDEQDNLVSWPRLLKQYAIENYNDLSMLNNGDSCLLSPSKKYNFCFSGKINLAYYYILSLENEQMRTKLKLNPNATVRWLSSSDNQLFFAPQGNLERIGLRTIRNNRNFKNLSLLNSVTGETIIKFDLEGQEFNSMNFTRL